MRTCFGNIKITGISCVVPSKEINIRDEAQYYSNVRKIERIEKQIGISRRRVVEADVTASDLSLQAAQNLIKDMNIDINTIDALVFVTQSPDYIVPPTSCVLHGLLGLSKTCATFDVNQSCTGYIYGLWLASSLVSSGSCKKILLLVGDTPSKGLNAADRNNTPIFGDAGTATILEYSNSAFPMYFDIQSDGTGCNYIVQPVGASRINYFDIQSDDTGYDYNISENSDLIKKITSFTTGNVSRLVDGFMDSMAVFDFTMNVIPPFIKEFIKNFKISKDDVDYLVLHQANKQIVQTIANEIGFSLEKTPIEAFSKYGNSAMASIPTVICDALSDNVSQKKVNLLLSGFGAGLSWGACSLTLEKIYCSPVKDYIKPENFENRDDLIKKWIKKLEE